MGYQELFRRKTWLDESSAPDGRSQNVNGAPKDRDSGAMLFKASPDLAAGLASSPPSTISSDSLGNQAKLVRGASSEDTLLAPRRAAPLDEPSNTIAASGIVYTGLASSQVPLSDLFTTYNVTQTVNYFSAAVKENDGSYLVGPDGTHYGYGQTLSDVPINELGQTYFVPNGSSNEATLIAFNAEFDSSVYSNPAVSVMLGSNIEQGFDYQQSLDQAQIDAIANTPYGFVVRYYSSDGVSNITPLSATEVTELENAHLQICTVFENKSEALAGFYHNGTEDALAAIEQAQSAGQTGGSAIYFAIDNYFSAPSVVESYFDDVCSVFNNPTDNPLGYKVGVYGSGASCAAAVSAGATYSWLNVASYGWPGSSTYSNWQMGQVAVTEHNFVPYTNLDPNGEISQQIVVGNVIFGANIDVVKSGVDFGSFGAASTDTTPPSLVHDGSVTLTAGRTASIPESQLEFDDDVSTHSEEKYVVITPPEHGTLLVNGAAAETFTQDDIDKGLLTYREDGSAASSDSFTFDVYDAANNAVTGQVFNFDITPPAAVAISDFNGDGDGDLQWQNTNGQAAVWLLNGSTPLASGTVGTSPGASWLEKGAADFDNDGNSDILWQNTNGQISIWFMDGITRAPGGGALASNPGSAWQVIGPGDFDGDGLSDILFQNTNGQAGVWTMDGLTRTGGGGVTNNPGTTWHVKTSGDFDGDGKADILWQNDNGQVAIWFMDGATRLAGGGALSVNPGPQWQVRGAGDFNGDGYSDILWQNTSTGQVGIWLMNGTTRLGTATLSLNPGLSWQVKGAEDVDGDGHADILFQNTNGQAAVWFMNGLTRLYGTNIGANPGTSWQLVAQAG